ncbi:Rib/alpha-like domain-containing protein, partial [Streptococcus mitis]|uniref:Rib/alpha-like domain-containing protein n=1 Tax=Streptococcus mitis TaxID=28037 RepID=UPI0039C1DFAF
MFKPKEHHVRQSQVEKFTRYSIRKVSFGAASVAVATGLFFLGGGSVQAAEQLTNSEPTEVQNSQNLTDKSSEPSKEVTGQESATDKTSDGQKTTSVKESATDTQASAVETPNVVTEKVAINTTSLEDLVAKVESRLSQLTEGKKTKSVIDDAKNLVNKAKELLKDDTKTQAKVDAHAKQLSSSLVILNSIKSETTEEKVNKNQDPRNGQVIPGKGESGFREAASTTNPIIPAKEGPTNNNKLGSGNNPKDGVFESAKNQFGDIDFTNATEKNKTVNKQWSRSTASQGGDTKILGSVTYNWKEKEITATEANNNNALNGWKIEGGEKVVAVKPEAPTNAKANRPAEFAAKPSKVYDLNGKVHPNENETPAPNHPLGVNAANQNYANGVNHSGMVGTHSLPKGYYLELGKKGTKISKEYSVNGNSRVMLSAITGGAYGNAGTAGTGERLKITVYDEKGNKISSIRDDQGIGTKYESEHISTPTGSGGNGDGWSEYRAIYEIPQDVKKIKVEIEALDDGTAINKSYLTNTNSTVTDGYFVGAVNLAVGSGAELTTDVKTNRVSGKYGEDNLYKAKQEGSLDITVKSVGGVRHYGFAETEVDIPEGVELPDTVKKPSGWVWFGGVPVASKNISWDESTRKLKIKYQTSGNNAGVNPYIGIGSNKGNNDGTRNLSIPFKTADNYKGTATFKVRTFLPNGLSDGQDNQALNTGDVSNADGKYHPVVNGLRNSDNPEYYYNKTIYIDSTKPVTPTIEAVHTDGVKGEGKDTNQPKKLLISVPEDETGVTNEAREKQDLIANDKNNNKHTLTDGEAATKVDRINHAIGGVTSLKVTLPNGTAPITLTKKADGWYNGSEKVNEVDGKLVLPLPETVNLDEASDSINPDKRIKVTVYDKAGNESEPAYGEVKNEAPTVAVQNPDLYVYKTKETDKWTNEKVLEKAVPSATDLEDDRDGVDSTKPRIAVSDAGNLNTTVVGTYPVKVQSTDSEGKKSTETTVNVHVLDLITVDPTVTTDPTDPSSTSPVSPKMEGTPVKEGDANRGTYPSGVTRDDLVKEVTRTIKYLKEADKDKVDAQPIEADKVDKIQKVTYKRTATVNPETKEVTYSDWSVYEGADKLTDATVDGTKGKFNEVPSPVVNSYLLVDNADKTVPAKEAPTPTSTGLVTPEVKKVLYKEIGSFVPTYPNGKKPNDAPEKIHYPNHPTDPSKPGDFGTITIPYVPGYTPVYNGVELTPKNPNNPKEGYKVPDGFNPADNFGNSEITYTPSNQKATVVIEKKVDSGTNEVVQSYELTGKSGEELPTNTDIENKIKELKNKGYEVESDGYHTADNHHPTFDDQEDVNPTDGTSTPSQTFKVVVKPRIIEVPVTTPHEKDTPVDPNGENPDLKWPDGLTETDLKTTAKRVISYVKKESDTATEEKAKDSTEQVVTFTRKAKVNLVDKTVEYTDWEAPNKTWDKVGVDVLPGYIADKKEIPAKEAATPAKDTKVIPDETDKVTYTKIGSWIPVDPTTGTDGDPIQYPNDPNDPTKTGEITQVIPHKDGYTPKDGNGTPLEPVNPANPEEGYKPPKITDPKANIKITYDKDDQKAKVKFVSVDSKAQTETELTDHALTLTGKSGETIPEGDVQTHIDVLKSMGYDIVDNPFEKDPVFDTKKDTNDNITQEFTIKVQPRVSTANPVYVVEGDKPTADKLKDAVTTTGDEKTVDATKLPETTGKVGDETLTAPVTVTYGSGDQKREETVKVPVTVLPKVTPEGVKVLKDSTGLEEVVKAKATEAATATTKLPDGVTVRVKEVKAETVPATTATGVQTPATAVVEYVKDGNVVATKEVTVPVTVVGSTPKSVVVFEGDTVEAKTVQDAVTPGTDGTKGNPAIPEDLTKTPGKKEVTVPVTYEGVKDPEQVKVPVTVLPVAKGEVTVPKGATVDKVKEVAKVKATEVATSADFKAKLPEGSKDVVIGEITEEVLATMTAEKGTNKGIVKVPVTYTVDGTTYTKDAEITVNVLGSEPKTVYTVEGTKPDAEKVKNAVTPGTGGTVNAPSEAGLPDTTGKVGAKDVTVPTTVTYPTGDETVNVPVEVLPKATPEKVITLKDTTGENLTTAVKEKAQAALGKLTLPSGVTVELVPNQTYAVPATDSNGDKGNVPVKVQYKDATGTVVAEDTISVPVTVVSSTPSKIVVFEGEKPTAEQAKGAVTPVTGGTVGTPAETALPETAGKAGATDVKVDVPVTYDNGKLTETVSVPVTVLPKPEADEILVPKNGDKEKAKEKVLAKAKKAIEDSTFTGKLPQGATVTVDETATVTVPDLTEDTEVEVTVKYTVDDQEKTTTVKVPVTVVESVPQIVSVDENNKQPDPEKSIDKTDYPEGSTFRYKTPEGQTSPIDVTTTGDKNVVVEVLDPQGNTIVEVPATVRVVGSTPQFVVADPTKKQPEVKDSITPGDYPEGTTFEYKTPVDTTTAGEKDVTVVAKLNGQPIAEVPAKVVVVDPKTQYVVADPSKPQPDASKSIDPEQYPDGTTFEYKTPVDTTTPGEKDVVVVAKDGEDKLVEVPTKVKVVQGNPQIVPVDEGKKQPSPEDSIDSNDYPDDATFEYKEEVDTSTPGDKKVTVVVKQGDKVLVEVPSTVRVVGSTPQFVVADPTKKQPEVKDSITPGDYPEGTTFEYKTPVDTTTAGEKDVTVVAKLNGQPIAEVPAKVVVVDPKTQYVVADPSKPQPDASKSIDPEQYPDGTTFEYKTPVDTTTPGEKDVVVVAKDGEDKLVEVPTKVKVVQGNPQIVPVDEGKKQPSPEDSIDSNDYPDDATFEYKEEVDTTTPGDKKVTVVVKQGDKVLVEVPSTVRVVGSTPQFVVADPTKKQPEVKDSITPGDYPEGTTFEYKTPVDTTTSGEKDVTVVAKLNGQPIVEVPAKVVVVDPKTQYVVADPSKPQPDASKSIDPEQYPEGTTFEYKTPVDTTTPGEKDVVVVAKDGEDKLVEVPTKVKVVQGNPQIVPVDEGKKQPSPEDSIDPNDYPDDATFEYKEEVDTSTPGDKKVTVVVKQGDKVLVEVPSTVRVVESYPKYVPVDPAKKQPDPKENINPNDFPTGTTFEYKDNTPVDTTTPGEKPVTVVAKLNGQPITEIPAKIVVVESKTQYVPVNAENDKKPKPQDSITPDDYPEGSTFEYKTPEGKTESYDGSTPGEKDVTVVVKDSDGDTIVEVPAKIKVVQGKEQLTPVNAEDKDKPKAEDSITPSDYPEDSTFEYKVPEGQTTPYDGTTPGDKPVTVVVKDKDGKVLVEVPATIKVVETKPTPIETPVTNTPLTEDDYTKGMKIPEGATVKVGDLPDLTTPGEKTPVKVTITLPNGKSYTVDVPVTVTPVKEIETPVTTTPLTPEDYTKGIKIPEGGKVTNVANIPDLTTPGKKDPVKVTIEL